MRKNYNTNYRKKNNNKNKATKMTYRTVAKIARSVNYRARPTKELRTHLYGTLIANGTVAQSFLVAVPTTIALGDQENQRTGNRVYLSGIKLNGAFLNNGIVTRGMRLIVCHNKNADGNLLDTVTWSDLFTNLSKADRPADKQIGDYIHPLNTDILDVLVDRQIQLKPESEGAYTFNLYIPIKKYQTYDALGATTGITSGLYYIIYHLCELDNDLTRSTTVNVDSMSRLFFKDA